LLLACPLIYSFFLLLFRKKQREQANKEKLPKGKQSMDENMAWWLFKSLLFLCFMWFCMYLGMKVLDILWLRPKRLEEHFAKQGIRGPHYRFFLGSVREMVALMMEASSKPMVPQTSHNIFPRVLAFYHYWKKIYGIDTF
jgi:PHYB activation tagged suppressor 1